jgi:glyoxylase-like metal-dependent hydrolase (beta-lactamase superfamily II)
LNSWFTVEEMGYSIFAISEYKHWEQIHSYLVIGSKKAALIDTGLGVSNIKNIVTQLTDLPIQVITTHAHWDHIGGHNYFKTISIHQGDAMWLLDKFPISLQTVKSNLLKEPCEFPKEFDIDHYSLFHGEVSIILKDNDMIDLGNRKLCVIHTPGHSPGHICLFEKRSECLFTGDLVYKGALDVFYPSTNPIDFMNSIEKIKVLPVKKILPSHFSLDVSVSIIKEISQAFSDLVSQGNLVQGKGLFPFKNFAIHL